MPDTGYPEPLVCIDGSSYVFGMSKAFTRESDDAPEELLLPVQPSPLPPGVKNYITADGAKRLREELKHLTEVARPRVAATIDPTGSKRDLAAIDHRIAYLGQTLQNAVVVEPSNVADDVVRFGATVTIRSKSGEESSYRLVGIDETDTDRNWISWRSPIARALLNAKVGDKVRVRLPAGEEQFEVLSLTYEL